MGQLSAQRIMVSDLNKHQKGAVYKFSFAHLTDIHVGEGIDDYGSPGFNDTMPIGDVGYSAVSLRSSVRWINAHAKQKNIRFVIITGDLTDSGEKSEFDKANEILSALAIPFVPQIGNHDVRPHTHALNAATASGDSVNNVVFAGEFDTLKHFMDKWDDGFRQVRVYSPYSRHEQFFQNFMFEYQGFGFVFFDLSPRFIYGRPKTDHGPRPRLNDFPNGSFDWLKNTLQAFPDKRDHNIFLFSHQPPHQDFMSIFNGLHRDEYDKLTHALLPYRSHLAYWIAGHVHRNRSYSVHTPRKHKFVMKVRETAANKEHKKGLLRIINVYEAPGK
ncbi:MAG: hypothetical protein JWO03_3129 [Bacteroidetes bacterium]|nr:hypothetical protein [Bacteroidota bacterium]